MKYAIIESGSKQYRVSVGDEIDIELVDSKDDHQFDQVLLIADGEDVKIGTPHLEGAKVSATIVDARIKDKKVIIFKYKNKTNYRKKTGHRQKYTRVKIKEIVHGS
ncbi:MAG: 50S ribosomal protein L21 [Candidatus Saganbacteria bacterium]|nr:50S ribosomal protein L21 [Candidatus Saganbacteria bacterium]